MLGSPLAISAANAWAFVNETNRNDVCGTGLKRGVLTGPEHRFPSESASTFGKVQEFFDR